MQDRRNGQSNEEIPAELRTSGIQQLEWEIQIIEGWLQDLGEARDDNPESVAAKKSYQDMLQSRKDLLDVLNEMNP